MRKTLVVLVVVLAFVSGACVSHSYHPRVEHHWTSLEWESPIEHEPYVRYSIGLWEREVSRRFPTAFIYIAHGDDFSGTWYIQRPDKSGWMPARDLARQLRDRFPGRNIVLLACNPAGAELNIPGVYHAKDNVWFVPDKDVDNTLPGRQANREFVGNIYEFFDLWP